jgi:hypothetical protein
VARRITIVLLVLLALGVAPVFAARSRPIRVSPRAPHLGDTITFSWLASYGTDNTADGYLVRFTGPGNYHCNTKTKYSAGFTWSPQDNSRYRNHRVKVAVSSRREAQPPPQANLSWCPGLYNGRVVFRDVPFGKTAPIIYRFVGSFRFRAG